MKFFEKLASIDRRIIYLLLALAVVVPILLKLVLPITVSEPVKSAYAAIDGLSDGSVVMVSIDYDASSAPEVQPMLLSVLRHCFAKKHKVVMLGQWPLGLPFGEIGMTTVVDEINRAAQSPADSIRYGANYVNLGYRPGYRALMVGLGREFRDFFATDYRSAPVDSLPLMRPIHNYNDIDLLVGLEAGQAGDEWIQYAGARYGLQIVIGATGVVAPDMFHYMQARQIKGLIGGLQGAAEYETLMQHPGTGTAGMVPQSWAHLLLLAFIVLGNVGYFVMRRKKA
ncbi:MAG: hypothetical protein MUF78_00060 [Candidatus Edwardsbacteria bacterium]|jgi:hypothetical protein|nr:hypothetical protein [Candidatus Edwardsbacteria bacterium]